MAILARSESRRGAKVIWLAVHSTEGNDVMRVDDATKLRDATWWEGSSHAICDNEKLLTPADGCVPYDRAAWTLRGGNTRSENIEQVGWARWTRDEWLAHPGTLDHTARWLAERSLVRGIPLVKLSPADVAAGRSGVLGHVDYTLGTGDGTHTDPGKGYPWDVVLAAAKGYTTGKTEEDELSAKAEQQIDQMWGWIRDQGYAGPVNMLQKLVLDQQSLIAMVRGGYSPESGKNNFHWVGDVITQAVGAATEQILQAISAIDGVEVDPAQVRAAIESASKDAIATAVSSAEEIAKALADEQDRRARDNDPATGPVS